jgi:hypothetical protein
MEPETDHSMADWRMSNGVGRLTKGCSWSRANTPLKEQGSGGRCLGESIDGRMADVKCRSSPNISGLIQDVLPSIRSTESLQPDLSLCFAANSFPDISLFPLFDPPHKLHYFR